MGKQPAKNIVDKAIKVCGAEHVRTAPEDLSFFSSDLYQSGGVPNLVVAPGSTKEVCELVELARAANCAVHIRGGGMSYSNAFLPQQDGAIVLDLRRLNKIRKIDAGDLYATVESGCTWKALDEALEPHGLRSVFWGPASGASATVGGSMSQGTANNQSAQIETSSNAVLSYEIVTGTGDVLRTGLDAQDGRLPTFRPYGPDLTGLFNADAGALGIKTAVTLKLEPRPIAEGGISFAFSDSTSLQQALRAAGETGIASAIIAMDGETAGIRSGETGLLANLKKLLTIVSTAHNPLRGLVRGAKIALAGRRVFETAKYTAHFMAEGASDDLLVAKERALRQAVSSLGDEIPSAAISMIRAQLFPDLPTTDFTGRRMLPIHGLLAWSRVEAVYNGYQTLLTEHREDLVATGVTIADVFTVLGRNTLLFEPVFYWKDALTDFHHRTRPETLGPIAESHPDNPEARALVETMKSKIIALMAEHGSAHLQIGKLYPYMQDRSDESINLYNAVKTALDPDNIINPGALGATLPSKG